MIARIIAALVGVVAVVIGLSVFLAPDDLAGCRAVDASADCRAADAIVVISGGDTAARTKEAIKLFKDGWAPYIIFSGAAADKDSPSNAEVMRQLALDSYVPETAAIIEEYSETTKQNAAMTTKQLEEIDAKRVILVTSGYHMRRASLEFEQHLGSEVQLMKHPVAQDKQWGMFWWATPWGWWIAVSEVVKIAIFYVGASH